jgi:hypothetical protein
MALTIDPSDAMPLGGYILPNFPKGYFISDNPNAQQLAGVVDQVLDLARLVGELDDPYRDRIKNSIAFGVGASSNAQMERYLSAVLGTNVTVGDGPAGSASFTVYVERNATVPGGIPSIVQKIKAAGTIFTVIVLAGSGFPYRLGDARVGDTAVGRALGAQVVRA